MKSFSLLFAAVLAHAGALTAAELQPSTELLRRGDAVLTVADLDARMSRLSVEERANLAGNHERMARLLDRMLLNRQLALEARRLGLDKNPDVRRDLDLAIEEVLATHRLSYELSPEQSPDFELLARERYQADPGQHLDPEARVVTHILISTSGRTELDAQILAENVREQATAPGADFAALVEQYSEDPGKASNQGTYTIVQPGQFVPEFEQAARELASAGDISQPIKTQFGFHIIRLDELRPERQKPFEEVRDSIVFAIRDTRVIETQNALRTLKRQEPETGNEEALRQVPGRYGAPSAAAFRSDN